jgi:tetratricopeptide (TPR) repeat protein
MRKDSQNPFTWIYGLLRRGRLTVALNSLLDEDSQQIKGPFRSDRNHAWYCVGDILYRQGKFDAAKGAFKKSLRTRHDDVQALIAIGNCYDELKKPMFAERYFSRALTTLDKSADKSEADREAIIFNLANAIFDQGRMIKAIKFYEQLDQASKEIREKAMKNLVLAKKNMKIVNIS